MNKFSMFKNSNKVVLKLNSNGEFVVDRSKPVSVEASIREHSKDDMVKKASEGMKKMLDLFHKYSEKDIRSICTNEFDLGKFFPIGSEVTDFVTGKSSTVCSVYEMGIFFPTLVLKEDDNIYIMSSGWLRPKDNETNIVYEMFLKEFHKQITDREETFDKELKRRVILGLKDSNDSISIPKPSAFSNFFGGVVDLPRIRDDDSISEGIDGISISRHVRWGSDNVIPVSEAVDDRAFTVKNGLRGDINIGEESIDSMDDSMPRASMDDSVPRASSLRRNSGEKVLPTTSKSNTQEISMQGMLDQMVKTLKRRDN